MSDLYNLLKFWHIMSFVFMSIPLFNLIVVNERAAMGGSFAYEIDRYMENIIRRGATRCYVFQSSVLISGICLLAFGSMGIEALWRNQVILAKFMLLILLMGLLTYVHLGLQPKIEALMAEIRPGEPAPQDFSSRLKPYRARRKRLAEVCLFLVIVIIVLGMQVYTRFPASWTAGLIILAALFSRHAGRSLIRFGWV
jgi:hypothetical protein